MTRFSSGLAACALMVGLAGPALADPTGRYRVDGSNPGGSGSYSGSVVVEKTGDTYRVTWTIGSSKTVGTGIGDNDFLAVSYQSGNQSGLAIYGLTKTGYAGVWTYAGSRTTGTEKWEAQ